MNSRIALAFFFALANPAWAKTVLRENPQPESDLIRIEEDGSYIYRQKTVTGKQSISARGGVLAKPSVQGNYGQNYADIYGTASLFGIFADYEYNFTKALGVFGAQVGGGLATAQGHGILSEDHYPAEEKYNLFVFPLSAGFIYRFEFKTRQIFIPYVNAGFTYFGLMEKRNDDKAPAFAGAPAAYGSGGAFLCVSCIDRANSAILAEDYGISSLSVVAEVRATAGLSQKINFTGLSYSGGVAFDF